MSTFKGSVLAFVGCLQDTEVHLQWTNATYANDK